jgi:hypothetical protein
MWEKQNRYKYIYIIFNGIFSGFGGLQVACWPLELKVAGSNRAEAVGFFRVKKSSAVGPTS